MKVQFATILAMALATASIGAHAASPGRFTYAGPTSADADVLSMKWRFGFHFDVRPDAAAKLSFSCDGIPESAVTVNAADLKMDAQGSAFVESAATAVSRQTTPWLYDKAPTSTNCKVVLTGADGKELQESAPVSFAPATKAVLLMQLQQAFEFNQKPRPAR
jgi:hypothetical protein